ncbi:putative zinc finger motif, C2HC5-type-domain-containing protein [Aspergillus bertholletiae]|uniref:Putative zinc finger motif, C2HC5-type-domain-containing protein n=1 Tax=Aspergillus bertholletiae TaxID=1226010 RepID=A0A5N7AY53_9EURO|nr:putative zinc finger motif, C2HC5-type-domain-containing protein [Aspergillus bertholletiae]
MADPSLISWGVSSLSKILPLDEESLTQIITYAASLPTEEGADHLKNLLGDSPAAFEFISAFSSRRNPAPPRPAASDASSSTPTATGSRNPQKKGKKSKPPLHSAGPPRRPDNFGDVTGGYKKAELVEDYMAPAPRAKQDVTGSARKGQGLDTGASRSSHLSVESSSAASSRAHSPAPKQSSSKPPPSASGPMLSDLLPNVKSKAAKPSTRHSNNNSTTSQSKNSLTTTNISDLTAAIAALEVSTNPTLGNESRKCSCFAAIHPLFEPAPNCLNCGKIICSLEGLQPCSFCGTALLSNEEVQSMIRELRAERGQEKMRAHNESVHREGGPGQGPSPSASSSRLNAAMAHRDKLLQFQAQNAKRTRVVDEAADFETPNVASTLWMSPAQRALALKKQQQILREMEEKARPEWEKKRTIMSLDIKGGKVTRVYQSAGTSPADPGSPAEAEPEPEVIEQADESTKARRGEAFSRNPLLAAGGLMRPVWKGPDGKPGEARPQKERGQTWRRVQDDKDDNEQWILDGGLHGYT